MAHEQQAGQESQVWYKISSWLNTRAARVAKPPHLSAAQRHVEDVDALAAPVVGVVDDVEAGAGPVEEDAVRVEGHTGREARQLQSLHLHSASIHAALRVPPEELNSGHAQRWPG